MDAKRVCIQIAQEGWSGCTNIRQNGTKAHQKFRNPPGLPNAYGGKNDANLTPFQST